MDYVDSIKGTLLQFTMLRIFMPLIIIYKTTIHADGLPCDKIHESTLEQSCGIDNSPIKVVYEGKEVIQTYPWLGTLYYPIHGKRYITTVVLISKQIVIGSAIDIDKLPKTDFRSRSRVVLGNSCSGPSIRVREYSYHPAYNKTTYSALVLIQLDTNRLIQKLRPICPPPAAWIKPEFYAITLSNDCSDSKVGIHKMRYVSLQKCKSYYRKSGLDVASMWPTNAVCAKTPHGRECVWKNGAVLMLRQNNTWSLVGFGVAGPGCRAPARFIDYTMSNLWTKHSIARIGRPAVTRLADNHLVMRRTLAKLQRYGPCDPEEIKEELFSDTTSVRPQPKIEMRRVRYNKYAVRRLSAEPSVRWYCSSTEKDSGYTLDSECTGPFTILSKTEYSCIIFKVVNDHKDWDPRVKAPTLGIRRLCVSPAVICYSPQYLQIDFYVEISFSGDMTYKVVAYGEEAKILDIKKVMVYTNNKRPYPKITPP